MLIWSRSEQTFVQCGLTTLKDRIGLKMFVQRPLTTIMLLVSTWVRVNIDDATDLESSQYFLIISLANKGWTWGPTTLCFNLLYLKFITYWSVFESEWIFVQSFKSTPLRTIKICWSFVMDDSVTPWPWLLPSKIVSVHFWVSAKSVRVMFNISKYATFL